MMKSKFINKSNRIILKFNSLPCVKVNFWIPSYLNSHPSYGRVKFSRGKLFILFYENLRGRMLVGCKIVEYMDGGCDEGSFFIALCDSEKTSE